MKKSSTLNLQIGFGISLILLVMSSILSYVSIKNLLESSKLVDQSNEVVLHLESIMSTMKDAETGQRGYLLTGKDDFLDPYKGSYDRAIAIVGDVQELTISNPKQQANLGVIRDILLKRLTVLERILNNKKSEKLVTESDLREGKVAMDGLRESINKAKIEENVLLRSRTASLQKFSSFTPLIIIIAALMAISVSVFSYIKVVSDMREKLNLHRSLEEKDRMISGRIDIIHDVAGKIASGDYAVRISDEEEDRLGSLSGALNKMAASLEDSFIKLSDTEWMQTGLVGLNDQMTGEKPLSELTADILKFVAGYTKSQAGAIYMLEKDSLWLETGFALTDPPQQIALGEGIVGQSALNDEKVWLKEIDESLVVVNHAAGQLRPKNIVIIPIHHERRVIGVVQLISIYEYPERKMDFLKNGADNIGIALHSAQNRKRLQELLEETQSQSEELQAQHSELENINSELEAQTHKLQTSEEELRVQQEELQQSNNELEERNYIINQSNDQILKKSEELAQATKYKSEFMANMSHELRTPLNSILLLSRYLSENSENNLNNDQMESASVILKSGTGLLNLIDELLDLSKIEAGKMELEYENIVVNDILSGLRSLFTPVAKEKNLDFLIKNDLSGLPVLETDRMRFEQILKNLIANGLKFTSSGHVRLAVRRAPDKTGFIEFIVSDTGIGIPKEKQGLVFDAFQQADGSTKRKFGGTGLGLSISRELARLLGGEITLSSELNKGSDFILTVPVSQRDAHIFASKVSVPEGTPTKVNLPKLEQSKYIVSHIPEEVEDDRDLVQPGDKVVLIIEDDTAFAKALLQFTRKRKYKGIVAVRGDHGVALAQQYKPIAILLDIHLPIKDGWQVMEELKSNTQTKHIPVHIMSSMDAKRESRMKGAVDFIGKPIAVDQMKQMFLKLEEALNRGPKKILIVEENPKHAQALAYFLETFNLLASVSKSTEESVEALQGKEIDCVIMDTGIDDKHAYQTLQTIKKNPGLENLPVIVFTGKSLSTAEESRIHQYADTIVVKTAHSYQRILDEVALFLHLIEENIQVPGEEHKRNFSKLNDILKEKKVLIADDDMRNIFSLTKSLEKHGMNMVLATNGKEAIQKLDQHPDIDIVLMDMMMPEMDGYKSTASIRADARFRKLPVIAVTAKAMTGDREKCIKAGASDYISKPVDLDQLTSLLRVWLYDQTINI